MNSVADEIMQQLGQGGMSQLSQHVGADPQTASSALSAAVPLLVSAMARNAQHPQGAQQLHQTLQQNPQVLDNVSGYLQNPQQGNGSGIVQQLLGGQQTQVQQGLSQATGLNGQQMTRLLELAAPLVIGYFARQQHQQNLDPGGLAQVLGQHQQQAQGASPLVSQLLGQFLGGSRSA